MMKGIWRALVRFFQGDVSPAGVSTSPESVRQSQSSVAVDQTMRLTPLLIEGVAQPLEQADRLAEQARRLWLSANWKGLSAMATTCFGECAADANTAALIGSAYCQLGDDAEARRWVGLALSQGFDRQQMARLLLSGAEHSLGNACSLMGQDANARAHWRSALEIECLPGESVSRVDDALLVRHPGCPV